MTEFSRRPSHGGDLRAAVEEFGIHFDDWLDLSTGINPIGWPVPALPPEIWQRLPEGNDGLEDAAAKYYGTKHLLACAGSQQIIQLLPKLLPTGTIAIPSPAYREHYWAWSNHGHKVIEWPASEPDAAEALIERCDYLLLINPGNPSGQYYKKEQIISWRKKLRTMGKTLIIDEAFIDCTPDMSVANATGKKGLIVLRSLGKFFGLAGIRSGIVAAWPEMLDAIQQELGPWHLSHPARWVTTKALNDTKWQQETYSRLLVDSKRLASLIEPLGRCATTPLFVTCFTDNAAQLHQLLASKGIWTRLLDHRNGVRFGLPSNDAEFSRLSNAIAGISP